jgi:hypothetical protein
MARVIEAMIWLKKAGSIWRRIIRISLEPSSRVALTKSSSHSDRNRPRTTRASEVQPIRDRIRVMAK